jgi:hypothetical protein
VSFCCKRFSACQGVVPDSSTESLPSVPTASIESLPSVPGYQTCPEEALALLAYPGMPLDAYPGASLNYSS